MYYELEANYFTKPTAYRTRLLTSIWGYEPSDWIAGTSMQALGQPFEFELWGRGGEGLAEVFLDSIPLFRKDLVAAIEDTGVDNLEKFNAVLRTPEGECITDYVAVNIVGLTQCADLRKSQYTDVGGTGLLAMSFRKLVIDPALARGQLCFRLAEAAATIVVHERVKSSIVGMNPQYISLRGLTA